MIYCWPEDGTVSLMDDMEVIPLDYPNIADDMRRLQDAIIRACMLPEELLNGPNLNRTAYLDKILYDNAMGRLSRRMGISRDDSGASRRDTPSAPQPMFSSSCL